MKTALVGYTGFVGGNLDRQFSFDRRYNTANIGEAFQEKQGLVVYAGIRAEKFLANRNPQADRARARQAYDNLCRMEPEKVILISTIDVYDTTAGKDEHSPIDTDRLQAYGKNRLELEELVSNRFDAMIVRLPALFGNGLKKNFLYDALTLIPSMLPEEKYEQLSGISNLVRDGYEPASNGFFKLRLLSGEDKTKLRDFFRVSDWNALYFTDSRNSYQYYNLDHLWADIRTAEEAGIRVLNLTSEPVTAAEVYRECFGGTFNNETGKEPIFYDLRSAYAELFGGKDGYCYLKDQILTEMKEFCERNRV